MKMRILAGMAAVGALAMMGAAFAAPPGVTEKSGAWVAPDGKPLYTFAKDMPGMSMCNGGCAKAWPPLAAAADAKADGDWTVVTREDKSKMWAYKGKPLYTFAKDTAGAAATGVSANWPLATK
jgi:predicted lipoprotein with Yx(FWY)xxD motif